MKHHFKRKMYLLSLCISLGLLFYQCKDDETIIVEESTTSDLEKRPVNEKYLLDIKAEDVEDILNQVATEGRGFVPKKEKGISNDNRNVGNPFGTIDSDVIAGLEDLEGNKTYTFKIDPYDPQTDVFYNFIVHTDPYGTIARMYIKEYQAYNGKKIGPDYDGKVSRYDIDGYLEIETIFTGGRASMPSCADCEDIDLPDDGDQDDGSANDGNVGGPGEEDTNNNNNDGAGSDDGQTGSGPGPGTGLGTGPGPGNGDSSGGVDNEVCDFEILVINCNGDNNNIAHQQDSCGGDEGPNNGNPSTQNFSYVLTVDCSTDNKAADPGINDAPIPCCDQDVVVIDDDDQNTEPDPEDPCDDLQMVTIDNPEIRQRLRDLIDNTTSTNVEEGFRMRRNPSTNQDSATPLAQGDGDCKDLRMPFTAVDYAAAHSHPNSDDCNLFGMFSGADIVALARLAFSYSGEGAGNHNTPTFMLAYNLGAFAIKFDNQEAVTALTDIVANPKENRRFQKSITRKYQKLADQPGEFASEGELIQAMFEVLDRFDLDISLYEATTDAQNFVTGWSKVNKESLAREECN